MKFCVALVVFWESVGFDTTDWRTSLDGTKALCHERYARVLTDNQTDVATYHVDDPVFVDLIDREFTRPRDESVQE